MGEVFLASQPALRRTVVLKRVKLGAEDRVLAQRFVAEARISASFDHPNIVRVFDFFEHDGTPYIVMEHVVGGPSLSLSLSYWACSRGPCPVSLLRPERASLTGTSSRRTS
jgi:serine/threonine protein kinase